MRESLIARLRCPRCREGSFALEPGSRSAHEIRTGTLTCRLCDLQRTVTDGIVDLLYQPSEAVSREAQGLARFAERMRADGWDRERIRQLPYVALGYWAAQAQHMKHLLANTQLRPGQQLLDVGSNTCWASNIFARLGLDVVALDITDIELQGLRAAECFTGDGEVYFERVLASMLDLPFADEVMDWIFCCQALHHNDRAGVRGALREMYRVLRPGGSLLLTNEPLRFPLRPKFRHGHEVAEFEGNEHVYFMRRYVKSARRAGFRVGYVGLGAARYGLDEQSDSPPARGRLAPLKVRLRGHRRGRSVVLAYRHAYFWWTHVVWGDVTLSLVCRKPARPSQKVHAWQRAAVT